MTEESIGNTHRDHTLTTTFRIAALQGTVVFMTIFLQDQLLPPGRKSIVDVDDQHRADSTHYLGAFIHKDWQWRRTDSSDPSRLFEIVIRSAE